MKFFTLLKYALVLMIFYINSGFAQTGFKYKIIFKNEILKQSIEVKSLLQKYTADQFLNYNTEENIIILNSLKLINTNSLSGKLEKLHAQVVAIELIENNQVNSNIIREAPVNSKEIQDKATKKQWLEEEKNAKQKTGNTR